MPNEIGPNRRRTGPMPVPPHPTERHQALPGQFLSSEDDPWTHESLRSIFASDSYREADQDMNFLQSEATRGVRLQLDFLKTEDLLAEHGVAHTIVVFGGTRIPEPRAATHAVETCKDALAASPADEGLRRRLARAQRIADKSHYYEVAREFGRLVGVAGSKTIGGQTMIMTGGGPGIMEAANRGAHEAGAKSIGLNITLPKEQYPNPYVTPELCLRFHYFAIRKLHFLMRARALVAFPGGYGTIDELFEVLSLAQSRKIVPVPVILIGESYWRRVFDPDFLVDEGVVDPEDRELFWYSESAEDAWRDILQWYEMIGRPLLPPERQP